jgi:hypothetical protein
MDSFNGLHYETGSVHNALALRGITAPHTGKPVSEALLLGISGGAAFGYFNFEYAGHAPQLVLLTRNTFDPMETLFDRLALSREVLQTAKPDKAEENLRRVLDSGCPALVWADMFSLPYAATPPDTQMWAMIPVVVTAIENGEAVIADRSRKPFRVPLDALTAARGRVKDDKYRVVCLDAPDMAKLPSAVQKGIWQAISLYVDAPPKGKRDNFGLAAYQHWADMLTNTRNKMSWERYYPPGPRLSAALVGHSWQSGAFDYIRPIGAGDNAERDLYADFLDEAAVILSKPGLKDAAAQFRAAGQAWRDLSDAMLPEGIPALKAIRDLKLKRREVWLEQGGAGAAEFAALTAQMRDQTAALEQSFPMTEAEARDFRAGLREHVLKIHDIERDAVAAMQGAMN